MNINRLMANMDNMARTNDFNVNIFGPTSLSVTPSWNETKSWTQVTPIYKNAWDAAQAGDPWFNKQIAKRGGVNNAEAVKWAKSYNEFQHNLIEEMTENTVHKEVRQDLSGGGISIRGIRCTNITLPGRSFITTPHTEYAGGPKTNRIQGIDYEGGQLQMTFMCDETFDDKNKIELWQQMIYDDAFQYSYYNDYIGHIEIVQQARNKQPIYSVKLYEAFPMNIQAQNLDATGGAAVQSFTCTFAYRTWSSNFKNGSGGLLGGLFNKVSGKINTKIDEKLDDLLGF